MSLPYHPGPDSRMAYTRTICGKLYSIIKRSILITLDPREKQEANDLLEIALTVGNVNSILAQDMEHHVYLAKKRWWEDPEDVDDVFENATAFEVGVFGPKDEGDDDTDDETFIRHLVRTGLEFVPTNLDGELDIYAGRILDRFFTLAKTSLKHALNIDDQRRLFTLRDLLRVVDYSSLRNQLYLTICKECTQQTISDLTRERIEGYVSGSWMSQISDNPPQLKRTALLEFKRWRQISNAEKRKYEELGTRNPDPKETGSEAESEPEVPNHCIPRPSSRHRGYQTAFCGCRRPAGSSAKAWNVGCVGGRWVNRRQRSVRTCQHNLADLTSASFAEGDPRRSTDVNVCQQTSLTGARNAVNCMESTPPPAAALSGNSFIDQLISCIPVDPVLPASGAAAIAHNEYADALCCVMYTLIRRSVFLTLDETEQLRLDSASWKFRLLPAQVIQFVPDLERHLTLASMRQWRVPEDVAAVHAAARKFGVGTFGLKSDDEIETDDEDVIGEIVNQHVDYFREVYRCFFEAAARIHKHGLTPRSRDILQYLCTLLRVFDPSFVNNVAYRSVYDTCVSGPLPKAIVAFIKDPLMHLPDALRKHNSSAHYVFRGWKEALGALPALPSIPTGGPLVTIFSLAPFTLVSLTAEQDVQLDAQRALVPVAEALLAQSLERGLFRAEQDYMASLVVLLDGFPGQRHISDLFEKAKAGTLRSTDLQQPNTTAGKTRATTTLQLPPPTLPVHHHIIALGKRAYAAAGVLAQIQNLALPDVYIYRKPIYSSTTGARKHPSTPSVFKEFGSLTDFFKISNRQYNLFLSLLIVPLEPVFGRSHEEQLAAPTHALIDVNILRTTFPRDKHYILDDEILHALHRAWTNRPDRSSKHKTPKFHSLWITDGQPRPHDNMCLEFTLYEMVKIAQNGLAVGFDPQGEPEKIEGFRATEDD
ncbi:hypothetical protein C8R45DRAFT_945231 [Mycena sanguinolenta]|nr:hypothetical protein C8R45DRAFT_945231 [Mycena sanguinolenta]